MEHNDRTYDNSFSLGGVPWAQMLNGEEASGFLEVPGIESFAPSPHTLEMFVSPSAQTSDVVRMLSHLDLTRDLEVTFLGETSTLHVFPRLGSLQRLALKNVVMGDGLLNGVVANPSLQDLDFQDVKYNGSFSRLASLENLRELKIGGSVSGLSHDCDFLTSLPALASVALELENPSERALTSMSQCPATIQLKLTGAADSIVMSTLSSVHNLHKLEFSKTHILELPRSFRGLHGLTEVVFTNAPICLEEIKGISNFPTSVSRLRIDDDFVRNLGLPMIAGQWGHQIKHLSLKVPKIGSILGLYLFSFLESVELYPKKEIDERVFRELRYCPRLIHVGIGGIFNVDSVLEEHFSDLNLRSLDISNTTVTSKTLSEIHILSNLKKLSFHCCVFDSIDFRPLLLLSGIQSLSFDRCYPLENHVLDILSSPIVHNLRSIDFTLSGALPDGHWKQVCARRRELSAIVTLHWML